MLHGSLDLGRIVSLLCLGQLLDRRSLLFGQETPGVLFQVGHGQQQGALIWGQVAGVLQKLLGFAGYE